MASGAGAAGIGAALAFVGMYGPIGEIYVRWRSKKDVGKYLAEGREHALLARAKAASSLPPASRDELEQDSDDA